jgi:hypothetical protein
MKFKIVLALILISTFVTPSAQAAEKGWRYWGYFQAAPGKTVWTPAMTGPTVDIPSVLPRVKPDFKSICAGVKADRDTKRIGLVIDFGSSAYAPKGEKVRKTITTCVRVAKESQGIDVLGQVTKIRAASSGLICGLSGYPAKECGVEIPTPKALIKK